LGWIDAAISTAGSIFTSVKSTQAQKADNKSQEKQLQLQLQAQREQAQQQAESGERIMKMVLIGGGILVTGGIIFALVKGGAKNAPKKSIDGIATKSKKRNSSRQK
jgi:hypothetical protein